MTSFLAYVWYPVCLVAAIASFLSLLANGASLVVATYLPIIFTGMVIVVLERLFPERADWKPRRSDVLADAAFIAFVQVAFARLLAFATAIVLADWMHKHAHSTLWPHAWPLAAQVVTMVLIVDFLRYWLHRACHSYPLLWRLHEVHHSPDILYTLNVGRFHPLEKALHFLLDSVPFMLLGVAPEVLAGYFLLYSVNGFFQHSNVQLRYGWLNYVVGSAETHRWHHARDPRTAMCNFSNTTIVWDLVFGTWYLPRQRLTEIGIPDRTYPKGFLAQMISPFKKRDASAD
jgi:sterol desaturase/sphingolipid hydroxylase (fatty acid hydroxylase superfamily)